MSDDVFIFQDGIISKWTGPRSSYPSVCNHFPRDSIAISWVLPICAGPVRSNPSGGPQTPVMAAPHDLNYSPGLNIIVDLAEIFGLEVLKGGST